VGITRGGPNEVDKCERLVWKDAINGGPANATERGRSKGSGRAPRIPGRGQSGPVRKLSPAKAWGTAAAKRDAMMQYGVPGGIGFGDALV